jgi:hypothetical protein
MANCTAPADRTVDRRSLSPEERAERTELVRSLLRDGLKIREIIERTGLSSSTVGREIRRIKGEGRVDRYLDNHGAGQQAQLVDEPVVEHSADLDDFLSVEEPKALPPAAGDRELVEPDFGEMDEHELVAKANEYYHNVQKAGESAVINAWYAGKALNAAKPLVGHGGWLDWLTTNFQGGPRLAQYYMALAEKTQRVSHLDPETSLRGALKAIGPAKERSKSKSNAPRPKPSSNAFSNRFYRYLSRVQDNALQLELMTNERKFAENFDAVRTAHRDGLVWAHEVISRVLKQLNTDQEEMFSHDAPGGELVGNSPQQ